VLAPEAVIAADVPAQTVAEFTVTKGAEPNVTVADAEPSQPEVVPVTVYMVVTDGFAVTVLPVVALSPAEGVQEYVVAPVAVRVADPPLQIVGEFTVTTGKRFTVTVEEAVPSQPDVVPVTI
jgi:hypothetical protein